jgi:hypothetical protein
MTIGCNHDAAPGYDLCPVCLGRNGGVTRSDAPARLPVIVDAPDDEETQQVRVTDGNGHLPPFPGLLALDTPHLPDGDPMEMLTDLTEGWALSHDMLAIIVEALNTVATLTEQIAEQDQVIRRQQAKIDHQRIMLNARDAALEELTQRLIAENSRAIGLEAQVQGLAHELAGHFLAGYIVATEPRDTSPRAEGLVFMRVVRNPDGTEAFWLWKRSARSGVG